MAVKLSNQSPAWVKRSTQKTYTVTVTPTTSGTVTLATGQEKLRYQTVNKECLISGLLTVASVNSPLGGIRFNLPFTCANLDDLADYSPGTCIIGASVSKTCKDFVALTAGLASVGFIFSTDGNALADDVAPQIQAGTTIYVQFSFPIE